MSDSDPTRVVVGLSGGVDSSAAASLLVEQGYDVVGITLKVWPQDCVSRAEDKCCGPQAVMDARSVADKLGIPYYLIDESKEFQRDVIDYFAAEYRAGRTPNPCVMCNEKLKFGNLINRAKLWHTQAGLEAEQPTLSGTDGVVERQVHRQQRLPGQKRPPEGCVWWWW